MSDASPADAPDASSPDASSEDDTTTKTTNGSDSASDTSDPNGQNGQSQSVSETLVSTLQQLIEQRLQWVALLRRAVDRLDEDRSMPAVIIDDVATLVRLVKAWRRGEYPRFPWRSLGVLSLAVLYFFLMRRPRGKSIAGIGLLDDAAVVAFVVRTTHNELNRFRTWERQIASN